MSTWTPPAPGETRSDAGGDPPRRRRDLRLRILVAAGAAVVLAAVAVWVVAFSPVLGVRTIEVRGVHVLSAGQVVRAADVAQGTPLVRIDTGAVARNVESLGTVARAQVSTSMPSTLVIQVTERTPVGWVRVAGQDLLVDRTGLRYRSVASRPANLPRLVLPAGANLATTAAVARVAATLPGDVLARVASIQALDPNAITLLLRGDRVVQWGSSARSAEKAQVLTVLLHRRGTQINLINPDMPVVRN